MANELTLLDMVSKDPKELVLKQSTEQQAQTYILLDVFTKALKDNEREALLNSDLKKYEWDCPNGLRKTLTIVKTEGGTEDVVVKSINYDKAIAYAKEHNLEIPMTKPVVDKEKLETMDWFQNNVEQFVTKEIKQRTIKPTRAIRVK